MLAPVQTIGFSGLPKQAMANASALMNTVKQVGTSFGITIITRNLLMGKNISYTYIIIGGISNISGVCVG